MNMYKTTGLNQLLQLRTACIVWSVPAGSGAGALDIKSDRGRH